MTGVRCEALTRKGEPCKHWAMQGTNPPRCNRHADAADQAETTVRDALKDAFLENYAASLNITASAKAVEVDRSTVWRWRYADPDFDKRMTDTRLGCVDALEGSLFQRAIGLSYDEITTENGVEVRRVTKALFDTRAAEILLRAHDPARYAANADGAHGLPRVPEEEERMRKIQADPATRAALDSILDADLD